MAVTRSHSLSIGIVGLPNSGKSTIFNALTKSAVPAENYPFCTIDKNVGVVKVPDKRLDRMAEFFHSAKIVPAAITFVDIAGLVKGASKGEGLGNQFLAHIREADAIMYVLRAFKSNEITHVYERINPADDLKIVRTELILKDIETVERRLHELQSKMKFNMTDDLKLQLQALEKVQKGLSAEIPAYNVPLKKEEKEAIHELWLLTNKPAFYILNIKGGIDVPEMKQWLTELKSLVPQEEQNFFIAVDCKMEGELEGLNEAEKKELIGLVQDYRGISDIILMAFCRLNLITFYTGNEKEANAWSIAGGATAKEAAGVIHTDLHDNFVAAEVVSLDEMLNVEGWNAAKEAGLIRTEGKDYIVRDGDYMVVLATK